MVHRGGPLLVVAGAGSGKTRVLTRRIAHLIATGDATPWEILAITFTNKAADEMRRRVAGLVGPVAERMWVSTFHAACVRILRAHADRLGYRKSFTIYDDTDSRRLVEHILPRPEHRRQEAARPRSSRPAISGAKAELAGRGDLRAGRRARSSTGASPMSTSEYEQRLFAASAMDFDDLLLLTVRAVPERAPTCSTPTGRASRTSSSTSSRTPTAPRTRSCSCSPREHHNVCVVGDSDQSIYRLARRGHPQHLRVRSRPSPTPRSSPSSRTTGRPRRSSTPPTP